MVSSTSGSFAKPVDAPTINDNHALRSGVNSFLLSAVLQCHCNHAFGFISKLRVVGNGKRKASNPSAWFNFDLGVNILYNYMFTWRTCYNIYLGSYSKHPVWVKGITDVWFPSIISIMFVFVLRRREKDKKEHKEEKRERRGLWSRQPTRVLLVWNQRVHKFLKAES